MGMHSFTILRMSVNFCRGCSAHLWIIWQRLWSRELWLGFVSTASWSRCCEYPVWKAQLGLKPLVDFEQYTTCFIRSKIRPPCHEPFFYQCPVWSMSAAVRPAQFLFLQFQVYCSSSCTVCTCTYEYLYYIILSFFSITPLALCISEQGLNEMQLHTLLVCSSMPFSCTYILRLMNASCPHLSAGCACPVNTAYASSFCFKQHEDKGKIIANLAEMMKRHPDRSKETQVVHITAWTCLLCMKRTTQERWLCMECMVVHNVSPDIQTAFHPFLIHRIQQNCSN